MKELLTTSYDFKIAVIVLFVDVRKAYNLVKKTKLIEVLKEFNALSKLTSLLKKK